MLRVGLTGGIGTGKTTVGRMFVDLGCRLIDADRIAHELLEPDQPVHDLVVEAFGAGVATAGRIDRKKLGAVVFNDPSRREQLNRLLHPVIIRKQDEFLARVEAEDSHAVGIVDAALMIEIGTYKRYDRIIVVTCPPAEQKRRLMARSGLTAEEAESRIRAQMPAEDKIKFAHYVIDTSGSLEETRRQVARVFAELKRAAA